MLNRAIPVEVRDKTKGKLLMRDSGSEHDIFAMIEITFTICLHTFKRY